MPTPNIIINDTPIVEPIVAPIVEPEIPIVETTPTIIIPKGENVTM